MFLSVLCSQLMAAKGLCELALHVCGKTARAIPAELAYISSLTQLENLQLHGISSHADGGHFSAALPPLTRLTRLCLRFNYDAVPDDAEDSSDEDDRRIVFPWADAVCGLTNLQQLCVTADTARAAQGCSGMFKGALPAALSGLTAMRHFTVLGMDVWEDHDDSDQLLLAALPALETAALQLHTLSDTYPGLGDQQPVVLSRVISLCLAMRPGVEVGAAYKGVQLRPIAAPALTELTLSDMWLAPESEQLSWLAGLPKLRRLVLRNLEASWSQPPQGFTACHGLTELVFEGIKLRSYYQLGSFYQLEPDPPGCCQIATWLVGYLPAGRYLSKLVRLNLSHNSYSDVPPCLATATALQQLDMSGHLLRAGDSARLQGLHVLEKLPRLREVNICGFKASTAAVRRYRAANPHVNIRV